MKPVEASYEKGLLRPAKPLPLGEGEHVRLIVVRKPDPTRWDLDKIAAAGETIHYEYDFGDGWQHELKIEKVLPPEADARYPRCLAGKRACPPEDCGGVPGYERMLEILANPNPGDEEYEDIAEWLGGDFDAEAFDLEVVNEELRQLR